MRKQYHFRESAKGYYAWDVHRLVELSQELEVNLVPIEQIAEIDENYWFGGEGDRPSCRNIVAHMKLVTEVNLDFPIILCCDGRLMDGMHRVARSLLDGHSQIKAVQFETTPKPDFVDALPDDLPY